MFNAGLVAVNFINALHSMGIGGCFLEFNNELEDELIIKKLLNIPQNEKIANSLAVGYYPNSTQVPRSCRKDIDSVYKEII